MLTVFLYALTLLAVFADQSIMSPNLTAIAHEFGFTDEERDEKLGGGVALAFFLVRLWREEVALRSKGLNFELASTLSLSLPLPLPLSLPNLSPSAHHSLAPRQPSQSVRVQTLCRLGRLSLLR